MAHVTTSPLDSGDAQAFGKAMGEMLRSAAGLSLPPTALSDLQAEYLKEAAALWNGAIERFTKEIAPLILTGPPAVTGFAGGRPKVEEIVAYWPALIPKSEIETSVEVLDA